MKIYGSHENHLLSLYEAHGGFDVRPVNIYNTNS